MTDSSDDDELITTTAAKQLIKLSTQRIRVLFREGKIGGCQQDNGVILVSKRDVLAYSAEREVETLSTSAPKGGDANFLREDARYERRRQQQDEYQLRMRELESQAQQRQHEREMVEAQAALKDKEIRMRRLELQEDASFRRQSEKSSLKLLGLLAAGAGGLALLMKHHAGQKVSDEQATAAVARLTQLTDALPDDGRFFSDEELAQFTAQVENQPAKPPVDWEAALKAVEEREAERDAAKPPDLQLVKKKTG